MRPTHKPLGEELRRLRDQSGLTQRQVASEVGMSAQTLSRLELGTTQRPDMSDVLELLDFYAPDAATRERITMLARFASARTVYKAIGDMGERQRGYAELETFAVEISEYQQMTVPGLLQTAAYARARLDSAVQLYPDLQPEAETTARISRQDVLRREQPPFTYAAVLDEMVLRRASAPPEVMREQATRLRELAELPNVSVRILPTGSKVADYYVPLTSFSVYRSPALQTVVVETITTDVHLRDESAVAAYTMTLQWLQEAALPEEESLDLMARLASDGE